MCNTKLQADGPRKAARQGKKRQTRQHQEPDRLLKKCLFGKLKGRRPPGCPTSSFRDVSLRDGQHCRISRPFRDAKDRLLWRENLVLHVPNPSCAGKRFDHCGCDHYYKAKHTDLVKAVIPKEAPGEEKPSGNRPEVCCLTGQVGSKAFTARLRAP